VGSRVLYIGGWGRSGSTLLSALLARAPGFTAVGEVCQLWRGALLRGDLCGCGTPIAECDFWSEVGSKAFGGFDKLDLPDVERRVRSLLRQRQVRALLAADGGSEVAWLDDLNATLYRAIGEVSGASVIVDSSKMPPYLASLVGTPEIDVSVVHLVRDSRGVAYALQKRVLLPERQEAAEMPRLPPFKAGRRWLAANLATELIGRRTRYARLTYEQLASAPDRSAREAAVLADPAVEWPGLDDGSVEIAPMHMVGGNPMRFEHGARAVRLDENWRTEFDRSNRLRVVLGSWPLLIHYGYRLRAGA
jgi:hypothetical protein